MIISGRNPVLEGMRAGKVKQVFIRRGAHLHDITFNVPVSVLEKRAFEHRFGEDAQGVAAEAEDFEYNDFMTEKGALKNAPGVVILDRIQDPQNMGAIIRAAHCFGIRDIIVSRYNQAAVTPAVIRASAGSLFYMNIYQTTNLSRALDDLKEMGFATAVAVMDGAVSLPEATFDRPVAVVIGSEGSGVREGVQETADIRLSIPMQSEIDSLNASQSAAVILYALFTGRKKS